MGDAVCCLSFVLKSLFNKLMLHHPYHFPSPPQLPQGLPRIPPQAQQVVCTVWDFIILEMGSYTIWVFHALPLPPQALQLTRPVPAQLPQTR